jgi:hypothetical protein
MYSDLSLIMQTGWAAKADRIVHFPIRNVQRLATNQVWNYDVIIGATCPRCPYHNLRQEVPLERVK